jgi:predicted Rossmann fold flavoprotein
MLYSRNVGTFAAIFRHLRSINCPKTRLHNILVGGLILKLIVIGGGAAGFFGAIAAATHNPQLQVTILEASRQALGKVLISGGGRCNVTHHCFEVDRLIQYYPRGGKALRGAFTRFQPKDTVAWFASRGVKLKTEADGRMFPVTDRSETIVDCLLDTTKKAGIRLKTGVLVKNIQKEADKFLITLKTGEAFQGDRLLLATGSNPLGYRWAKELGHSIETPVPSLFTFNIRDPHLQDLAGISVDPACVQLLNPDKAKLEQTAPLLVTHWGLSGPAILKLSAWGARILAENNYRLKLKLNWLPEHNIETLNQYFGVIKEQNLKKKIGSFCPVQLPKRLWQRYLEINGIDIDKIWAEIGKKDLNKLSIDLTQGIFAIQGKGIFKEEFVTCGGINLKEVNFKTMESKIIPKLYLAGEILDIDGVTGGFNFQSAWTTGWLAGIAAATPSA